MLCLEILKKTSVLVTVDDTG